jgi:predicted transcriptional regulator
MSLSVKQLKIMNVIHAEGQITLERAVDEIGGDIYYNAKKYVGETLARMVKRGLIQRKKPGVFVAPKGNDRAFFNAVGMIRVGKEEE